MADANTPNHSFILPEVGLSKATWGTKLNQNWGALDAILNTTSGLFLARAGGTMTGAITLSGDPTAVGHATRKSYVDGLSNNRYTKAESDAKYVPLAGGTLTGFLNLHAAPTLAAHAARKDYVDTQVATRLTQTAADARYVGLAGGTLTGPIISNADPTLSTHLARKGYVDAQVATRLTQTAADARYLGLAGGTMTGQIVAPADPTLSTHLARKGYVDTQVATRLTQSAGDSRYATLAGGNSYSGTQTISGSLNVRPASGSESTGVYLRNSASQLLGYFASNVATTYVTIRAYATPSGEDYRDFRFEGDTGRFVAGSFVGNGSLLTFLNASALGSGTVPDARLPTTVARAGTQIIGGNGLSGSGDLSSDVTISLGVPSSITSTSTNSRSATSHTHALSAAAVAELVATLNVSGLGMPALMKKLAGGPTDPATTTAGSNLAYADEEGFTAAGFVPPGIWMVCGHNRGAGGVTLYRRVE